MIVRPRATKKHLERAEKWIIDHPGATIPETMINTKTSQGAIQRIRRRLILQGILPPHPRTTRPAVPLAVTLAGDEVVKAYEAASQGDTPGSTDQIFTTLESIPREERRKILERILQTGLPSDVIRANEAIEKMDRAISVVIEEGPPAPLHLDDAISDITDMIEALAGWGGEEAVQKAVTAGLARFYADQPPAEAPPLEEPVSVPNP